MRAVAWIQSLAWKLPYVAGAPIKLKKKKAHLLFYATPWHIECGTARVENSGAPTMQDEEGVMRLKMSTSKCEGPWLSHQGQ